MTRRTARTYWRERDAKRVLADLDASGLPVAAFAREQGLSAERLYRWRRRLQPVGSTPEFLPVRIASQRPPMADIELLIGDGVRVRVPRGFCDETLTRLLGVLGGEASC